MNRPRAETIWKVSVILLLAAILGILVMERRERRRQFRYLEGLVGDVQSTIDTDIPELKDAVGEVQAEVELLDR